MIDFFQGSALSILQQLNALYAEILRLESEINSLKQRQVSFESDIVFLKVLGIGGDAGVEEKTEVLVAQLLALNQQLSFQEDCLCERSRRAQLLHESLGFPEDISPAHTHALEQQIVANLMGPPNLNTLFLAHFFVDSTLAPASFKNNNQADEPQEPRPETKPGCAFSPGRHGTA